MKKKVALLFSFTLFFSSSVFADESGYITKEQIEAAGKNPYSINYKYQQDYLSGKAIPESAVYYEKMVNKSALESAGKEPDSVDEKYRDDYFADNLIPESAIYYKQKEVQSAQPKNDAANILNWNGEYKGNEKTIKISQDGVNFNVTVVQNEKTKTSVNSLKAILNQMQIANTYDKNSYEYKRATQDNIVDNLYGSVKTTTIPEKTLFSASGTLNGNVVWLYPGSNYKVKLTFEILSQKDWGSFIETKKQVTMSDNTRSLGKNPFDPEGYSFNGTYTVTTKKYK